MEYRIATEGLMCGHCDAAVETELLKLPGVTDAEADHGTQTVIVESARELHADELAGAFASAGSTFRIVSIEVA